MLVVPFLIAEYALYMSALALVAWHTERLTGRDAFALVPALAVGFGVSVALSSTFPASNLVALLGPLAAAICFRLCDRIFEAFAPSLLEVLVLVVGVLAIFDWATQHTPLTLDSVTTPASALIYVFAGLPWLHQFIERNRRGALITRLGTGGAWAATYWGGGLGRARTAPVIVLLALVPAVLLPLTTTGVLSVTILKDAALAMLFARVCGSRQPVMLLALAATAACLRLGVGFAVASNFGPPVTEAGLYLAGLVWLRSQAFRVEVGAVRDR